MNAVAAVHISPGTRDRTLRALAELAESVKAMLEDEERLVPADPAGDEVLSLVEAAAELQEPVTTVRAKCQRGDIRGEKRGKLWKISRREIRRYRTRAEQHARLRAVEGKSKA